MGAPEEAHQNDLQQAAVAELPDVKVNFTTDVVEWEDYCEQRFYIW